MTLFALALDLSATAGWNHDENPPNAPAVSNPPEPAKQLAGATSYAAGLSRRKDVFSRCPLEAWASAKAQKPPNDSLTQNSVDANSARSSPRMADSCPYQSAP